MRYFEKFTDLQAQHTALIKQQRDEGANSAFLETVQAFIEQGRASGALLDVEADRDDTQTILDYWSTRLVRESRPLPDTTLAEFDPNLAPELPEEDCPYRGLSAFTDAHFFYGREDMITYALQKLRTGVHLVAVVGPSGSGKSSVVLGGLLEALKNGAVREANAVRDADGPSDSAAWHTLPTLVPGQNALTRLDATLSSASDDGPNLLVIDQFEELFTLTRDEAQSRAFDERLMAWLAQGNRIILTLRSDFEQNVTALPALYEAFEQGRVDLRPMNLTALRNSIEKPAAEVGLRFDAGIVDDVLGKMLGVNEGLPLLQFTLLKLWKMRQRNRITWEAYRRLGGDPRRALGKSAEALYQGLTPAQQSIAKQLFLKLVTPKEGENEFTRNRLSHGELTQGENPERVNEVLAKLLDEGLLRSTGNDAQIEVMHEALVRNWPTLDQWLRDERSSLERRFLLQRRATRWHEDGQPSQTGLSGHDLEEAVRLEELDELTQAYVSASVAAQQATEARDRNRLIEQAQSEERDKLRETQLQQAQAAAKAERRRRQAISILLVISLITSTVTGWAIWQSQKALERAITSERSARSRELAAVAQVELQTNVETSVLIAIEAYQLANIYDNRLILEQSLLKSVKSKVLGHKGAVMKAVWSPDGKQVLTADMDETAHIWDANTGKEITRLTGHTAIVNDAQWSPDGKQVLIASSDNTARIWDASNGKVLTTLSGHTDFVYSTVWSPDGKQVLTSSWDHTARIWDASTGKAITTLSGHTNNVNSAAWSPDGKQVVTASDDKTVRIWDVNTGKTITTLSGHTRKVAIAIWSPDGKHVLTIINHEDQTFSLRDDKDNAIRIWDAGTGKLTITLTGHTDSVHSAAWSSDGKQVLTTSDDKTARIWDANTGKMLTVLSGHTSLVHSAVWSPDGKQILTSGFDHTARVWDVKTGASVTTLSGHTDIIYSAVWSPDGKQILTSSWDHTARIWDINTGKYLINLSNPGDFSTVEWSPDGKQVLTYSDDKTARIWDASTGKLLTTLSGHTKDVTSAKWSPDGKQVLTYSDDRTARIWDASTGKSLMTLSGDRAKWLPGGKSVMTTIFPESIIIWDINTRKAVSTLNQVVVSKWSLDGNQLMIRMKDDTIQIWDINNNKIITTLGDHGEELDTAVWSPDGKQVVIRGADDITRIWDTDTDKIITTLGDGIDNPYVWSPDGKQVLTGIGVKTARIWDANTGKSLTTLIGHTSSVSSAVWSPDGKQVLTTGFGSDRTTRIWDANTGKEITRLTGHTAIVNDAQWSPDSKRIATASDDGTVRLYYADIEDLIAVAKTYVTRELTCVERVRYLSEELDCIKRP